MFTYLDLYISQWSKYHSTYRNRRRNSQDRSRRTTHQHLVMPNLNWVGTDRLACTHVNSCAAIRGLVVVRICEEESRLLVVDRCFLCDGW